MRKLIFYAILVVIGIAVYSNVSKSPHAPDIAVDATTAATAPTPNATAPKHTVIPDSAFGEFAGKSVAELEQKAKSVLKSWDADNKAKRALSDDQIGQLIMALGQAADGTAEDATATTLITQLGMKREDRIEAAERARIANDSAGRDAFADQLERNYLSQGLDVTISVSGSKHTTITLRYVLLGRPTVYQLANDSDFVSSLTDRGFTMVIFTDGYDSTWRLDLVKNKFV